MRNSRKKGDYEKLSNMTTNKTTKISNSNKTFDDLTEKNYVNQN